MVLKLYRLCLFEKKLEATDLRILGVQLSLATTGAETRWNAVCTRLGREHGDALHDQEPFVHTAQAKNIGFPPSAFAFGAVLQRCFAAGGCLL